MKKASGTSKNKPFTLNEIVRWRPAAQLSEDLARLRALRDDDIDLSDIPEVTAETGWGPNPFYEPGTGAPGVTIRLNAPDAAMARKLSRRKKVPYQVYVQQLLHGALERELAELDR